MTGLGEWIVAYLQRLRPELRVDLADRRLQQAARTADHNGWTPAAAAERVNSGNYQTARVPAVIALIELERVAGDQPHTGAATPIGCISCVQGWLDDTDGGPTRPCHTCRPQLAARLARIPPPGHRDDVHQHYLRHKRTTR